MLELLEPRRFFAVAYDPATGALAITGTDHSDAVIFSEEILHDTGKHVLRLHFNGDITDYKRGSVSSITIDTGTGADTVILGSIKVPARIDGGPGDDKLSGGDERDTINGQGGDDYLFGRKGSDKLTGGLGYDLILGGPGDDKIVPLSDDSGDDTISGGRGSDTVDYTDYPTPVFAYVGGHVDHLKESDRLLVGIETILGSAFGDRLVNSTPTPVLLMGGLGDDTITGGSGRDTLDGGAGADILKGMGNKDVFVANDGEIDTIDGGSGADTADLIDAGVDVVTNVP
jgi:Ca2+-binding RTX toxin-like protein